MKNLTAVSIIILLILIGVGAGSFILSIKNENDVDVILDGHSETGYEAAGYLIAYKSANYINRCSGVYLQNNIFLTAAHCLEQTTSLYSGIGNFKTNPSLNYSASNYEIDPDWGDPNSGNDLSVLYLQNNVELTNYPTVISPQLNCNYIVVGYGLSSEETNLPIRKSATLCITSIQDSSFKFRGQDGTICYGDSGAPIFDKVTGKVVGIVSGLILPRNTSASGGNISNCTIEFEGNATRIDVKDFWEDNAGISVISTSPIPTKAPIVYPSLTPFPTVQNTPTPTTRIPTVPLNTTTPTVLPNNQRAVSCGESCVNNTCEDNLKCGAGKVCLPDDDAGACFASIEEYCHPLFGIFCNEELVCRDNKCVLKIVEEGNQFSVNISFEQGALVAIVVGVILGAFFVFARPKSRLPLSDGV